MKERGKAMEGVRGKTGREVKEKKNRDAVGAWAVVARKGF